MDRRTLLRRGGLALATGLAGCSGDDDPAATHGVPAGTAAAGDGDGGTPTATATPAGVVSRGLRFAEGDDGQFVVVLDVANTAEQEVTRQIAVSVTYNETTVGRNRDVTLGTAAERTLRFTFEVAHDDVMNASHDIQIVIGGDQ